MKIKVNTKELQEGLKKLERVINDKSKIDELKGIKIKAVNNTVHLIATDLINYVSVELCNTSIIEEGLALLGNVKSVLKSLKFFKEDYTIIETDTNIVIANANKMITVDNGEYESFPDIPEEFMNEDTQNSYEYNTKDLYDRMKRIDYARSKERTREFLRGVYFHKNNLVTCDGYRLATSNDDNLIVNDRFLIDPLTVDILLKTLDRKNHTPLLIATGDKYVVFDYENVTMVSRLMECKFINYQEIFQKDPKYRFTISKKDLRNNIEFLNAHCNNPKQAIIWSFANGLSELKLSTDQGTFTTETNINVTFDFKIAFNVKYMLDMLKSIKSDEIEIALTGELLPIEIVTNDGDKDLLLPVKIHK